MIQLIENLREYSTDNYLFNDITFIKFKGVFLDEIEWLGEPINGSYRDGRPFWCCPIGPDDLTILSDCFNYPAVFNLAPKPFNFKLPAYNSIEIWISIQLDVFMVINYKVNDNNPIEKIKVSSFHRNFELLSISVYLLSMNSILLRISIRKDPGPKDGGIISQTPPRLRFLR